MNLVKRIKENKKSKKDKRKNNNINWRYSK